MDNSMYTTKSTPMYKGLKHKGDYIGMRFGSLVVIGYPTYGKGVRHAGALCKCDCGNERRVFSMSDLIDGRVIECKECGRKRRSESMKKRWQENPPQFSRKPPRYGELCKERLYTVWSNMRARCKEKYGCYSNVSVCDEWQDYLVFREWAYSHGYDENAPRGKCTIDRINPFGNYEPGNCRFTDVEGQAKNKRNKWADLDDETREMIVATTLACNVD